MTPWDDACADLHRKSLLSIAYCDFKLEDFVLKAIVHRVSPSSFPSCPSVAAPARIAEAAYFLQGQALLAAHRYKKAVHSLQEAARMQGPLQAAVEAKLREAQDGLSAARRETRSRLESAASARFSAPAAEAAAASEGESGPSAPSLGQHECLGCGEGQVDGAILHGRT